MDTHQSQTYQLQTNLVDAVNRFIGDSTVDMDQYVRWLQTNHPDIASLVYDITMMKPADLEVQIERLQACREFSEQGRGSQWATTIDQHLEVRKAGASALLGALPDAPAGGHLYFLLDVFGGAGFIAQFAQGVFRFHGTVITSDPSALMVRLALQKRLPALWQRAQELFMTRSDALDAVLFAYGTHHVPVGERLRSFQEAWRVLKPDGALVFHDFEERSPTARWFEEVVDPYTVTGHKHAHFTFESLQSYFAAAGFDEPSISEIDDCFLFSAPTEEEARAAAIEFMAGAYGLEKLERSPRGTAFLWSKINDIFSVEELAPDGEVGGAYQIVIHRPALLGVGQKRSGRASVF